MTFPELMSELDFGFTVINNRSLMGSTTKKQEIALNVWLFSIKKVLKESRFNCYPCGS
jgi:hypothetical protein